MLVASRNSGQVSNRSSNSSSSSSRPMVGLTWVQVNTQCVLYRGMHSNKQKELCNGHGAHLTNMLYGVGSFIDLSAGTV